MSKPWRGALVVTTALAVSMLVATWMALGWDGLPTAAQAALTATGAGMVVLTFIRRCEQLLVALIAWVATFPAVTVAAF